MIVNTCFDLVHHGLKYLQVQTNESLHKKIRWVHLDVSWVHGGLSPPKNFSVLTPFITITFIIFNNRAYGCGYQT